MIGCSVFYLQALRYFLLKIRPLPLDSTILGIYFGSTNQLTRSIMTPTFLTTNSQQDALKAVVKRKLNNVFF